MLKLIKKYLKKLINCLKAYWRYNLWHKIVCVVLAIFILSTAIMYGLGQYYIYSQRNIPLQLGVSFIPDQAEALGLNPKQTMDALLSIGVKHFRLTSYWSDMEPTPGHYDFSTLDWEFAKAEAHHAKIILTVGLRQPDWPECHMPTWVGNQPMSWWQPKLEKFMTAVIERYKNSPALESYQLENEYFLKGFGDCTNFSRQRLIDEYNLVKKLDPHHPIIIGRSNNAIGIPIGQPQANLFSISVYRRVWDANITHRYLEYPWPAWYYAFLAELQKIVDNNRNMIIGELQADTWTPHGLPITQTTLAQQNQSMNATRMAQNIRFAEATGMKQIYLWGAEYWYYRMEKLHDPSLWNVAKQFFAKTN
jgi:hypothetical protein